MDKQESNPAAVEKTEDQAGEEKKRVPPGLLTRSTMVEQTHPEQKSTYGFKGGIIAFVDLDGKVYITPGTRLKLDMLTEAGFKRPRPQIEVPYSDATIKSKRWLRKMLPKAEIIRSVKENRLPKLDAKVYAALLKVNLEGIRALPEDFLSERCAKVKEKLFHYVGLCASYCGILSFTDWEVNTWVTPYSDSKKDLLVNHGYVYLESTIHVPYSLESEENREWLSRNIPVEEWARTRKEIEEHRLQKSLEKAKKKIKELGLKDLPEDLLNCSAASEENLPEYIGMAGSHNGILSFTDPLGKTYVTPATREKVDLLKSLGYQFMGPAIKVPYSLKTDEDIAWLKANISAEHWEAARQTTQAELEQLELEQAERRQRSLQLEDLPNELVERSIKTDSKQTGSAGQYYVRNDILGFVDPAGFVYITPVTKKKISLLRESGYRQSAAGFRIPYSDGTKEHLDFIRRHLSQEELDKCAKQRREEAEKELKTKIEETVDSLDLKQLSEDLISRSAKTEKQDIQLIGHYCSRSGLTCFICEDGYFYVTPTTPWKEEALRKAGYGLPDHLIKIPYGSQTEEDIQWLKSNLPEGEFEKSSQEVAQKEKELKEKELKMVLEKSGISDQPPEEIASRSAKTEELCPDQVGHYIIQGEILAFVGPDQHIWITPYAPSKTEILQNDNYKYATRRIVIPFVSDSEADIQWRQENLPEGELQRSREELQAMEEDKEDHLAHDIADKRSLRQLDSAFLQRCLRAEKVSAQLVGVYIQRSEMLFFVDSERNLHITPFTQEKLNNLIGAGYYTQDFADIPHASGSEEDMQWIESHLPEGELERTRNEIQKIEKVEDDEKVKENIEKFSLKPIPASILERSADSGQLDPNNIGRLGIYRGVLAFVQPDERVIVSWYTPDKQEALENCGYKLEGRIPIKVPYAMPDPIQRQWLLGNLPEPDDEEQISVEENAG
jgi:hypothetical protein